MKVKHPTVEEIAFSLTFNIPNASLLCYSLDVENCKPLAVEKQTYF